jgi:hypothetical protein
MKEPQTEFEGTWEEVSTHASEFRGRRVRLFVLESPGSLSDVEDRLKRMDAASGRLTGPHLPDETLRRENLYDERGALAGSR